MRMTKKEREARERVAQREFELWVSENLYRGIMVLNLVIFPWLIYKVVINDPYMAEFALNGIIALGVVDVLGGWVVHRLG